MMRARWLALGLLLGLATLAYGQGGPGFFMSGSCSSIANPVTGSTVCWQTTAPNSWFYWDGAAFSPPTLGGPYAPTTFLQGGVLIGQGTGPIAATLFPTVSALSTNGASGVSLAPFGAAAGNTGPLIFYELAANGTDFVYFRAPDAIAAIQGFVWPSISGTSGQCLGTNGANPATLSWVACSPGAGSGITSLNALTAVTQTFANDTNVTITSVTSTHTLGWTGTLAVSRGGLGVGTLALNGVVLGNGTGPVVVAAAGAADTVFRVPGAGGTPAFGALDVSKAAAITGLMRTANLGSGTANNTTFLRGDQTWQNTASITLPVYNFVFNSDMEVWGAGTAAAPTGWLVANGTFAKDTTFFVTGTAALAITRTVSIASASQNIKAIYPTTAFWGNQVVTCGAWVRATVASTTYLIINDGIGSTASSKHSGGSTFEFITVSRTISNIASQVAVTLAIDTTNTTSQFDSVICVLGSSVANWQPSGYQGRSVTLMHTTGTTAVPAATTTFFGPYVSATETEVEIPIPFRCVVNLFRLRVSTAPGGAQTHTATLRVNEADTTLVNGLTSTSQQIATATQLDIAGGARTAVKFVTSATAAATQAIITLTCDEVPAGI